MWNSCQSHSGMQTIHNTRTFQMLEIFESLNIQHRWHRVYTTNHYHCQLWFFSGKENPFTDPVSGEGDPTVGEVGSPSDPALRVRGLAPVTPCSCWSSSCLISWMYRPFLYRSMPLTTFFSGWKWGMST